MLESATRSDHQKVRTTSPARRCLFALALVLAGLSANPRAPLANEVAIGQPAPPLTLRTLDGNSIATTDLRGNVVVLAFWATWCVPCREEMPVLSAYAAQHAGQGLKILGISLDGPDQVEKVRQVAATFGFPVGLLGSAWAGGYGRIWRLPVSFVIDREGRIRYDGWRADEEAWTPATLERIVGPLLQEQASSMSNRDP